MGKCVSDEDSGSSLGDADIEDDRSYTKPLCHANNLSLFSCDCGLQE